MKRISMILLALAASAIFVRAQTSPGIVANSPTISTTGKAEVVVEPDTVSFGLSIENENKELKQAKDRVDAVVAEVMKIAAANGIQKADTNVSRISIDQRYQYVIDKKKKIVDEDGDEIGTKEFLGYKASAYLKITLKDIVKFEKVFGEFLASGVNEIDNVAFSSSKDREFKDKARDLALVAAKEKAAAMAGALGQQIGKAIKIEEVGNKGGYVGLPNFTSNSIFRASPSAIAVGSDTTTFSPGSIIISAEVNVVFLLD
ncbi:MAG: SIMPL domain-containing protein [Pyrinomonadaceae bacterium]